MKHHLRSGIHTLGTNLLQVASVLTITALVARQLGPEGKGAYDLYVTTAQLFSTLLGFSLPIGITFVVAAGRADLQRLERAGFRIALAQAAICFPLLYMLARMALLPQVLPASLGCTGMLIGMLGLHLGLVALSTQYRAVLVGQQQFVAANHGDILKQAVALGLILVLLLAGGLTGAVAVPALVFANTAAVAAATIAYRRGIAGQAAARPDSGLRESARYALPCAAGNLVQFVNYRLSVYFVNAYAGAAALGVYQSATFVAQALTILPGAVAAITFPAVAHGLAQGSDRAPATAQCARVILWISLVCGAVLALLAPVAIPLFFGSRFAAGIQVLWVLLPATVVFCPAQVLASYLAGAGRPQLNLYASLAGAVFTVALNRAWVPAYGILGAAAATAVAQIGNALLLHLFFISVSRQPNLFWPTRHDAELLSQFAAAARRRLYAL
jgi:O-antigen/teichoic acid export membrane protein